MPRLIHALGPSDRARLCRHFLKLNDEDRRLRFGGALPEEMIRDYVDGINFDRDRVLAAFDSQFAVIAVVHVGQVDGTAELGLSVLPAYRREGLAQRLIQHAVKSARAHGCQRLWIHFMSDNAAMAALTRKLGMRVESKQGEADAWLDLPIPTAVELGVHFYQTQWDAVLGAWRQWLPQVA